MVIQSPLSSKEFTLLFDHSDFLIIDKFHDVSFHNEDEKEGLSTQVKKNFPNYSLFPVHRLDKVTSGVVIFAKSSEAANKFRELFEKHEIEKIYLALSTQRPKKKQGVVQGGMKKSRRGAWKLTREKDCFAKTLFSSYFCEHEKLRLFKLIPQTGRTHQIRVAMKSLGSPILGDTLYGGMQASRCFLHAYKIKFVWNNEQLAFESRPQWPCLELLSD